MIQQGQQNVAMSHAALGTGKAVTDWGIEKGIPAVKKGATWVGDRYDDLQKHEKARSERARKKEKELHDKNVALDGPDYRTQRLKKIGGDVYDATTGGLEYVGNEISSIGGLASDFAGSAYDAATSDTEKPQTALAGSDVKPKKRPRQ
jgi:hypothetical protein